MANIPAAMDRLSVSRLVQTVRTRASDPHDTPEHFDRAIKVALKLASRYVYGDVLRTADTMRASDRDWTIVRVKMLTDDPP